MDTTAHQPAETLKHAAAGPSSAATWMACPASVTQARGKVRQATVFTREGSAAHAAAELKLAGKPVPEFIEIDGEDVLITSEMLDHVDSYVAFAEMLRDTSDIFLVEQRVSLDWYYAPDAMPEPIFGTADLIAYSVDERMLTVVDFKYGAGHSVDVVDNPQLMIYALGALGLLADMPIKIRLVIVQPRVADPVKSHIILLSELTKWAKSTLEPAIIRIGNGDALEKVGDYCRWCVRAAECSAMHSRALTTAKMTFEPSPPLASTLSTSDIAMVLEQAELISAWVSKVRLEAESRIKNGDTVEGWKLVAKRGVRKWVDEDAVITEISDRLPLDEMMTEPELKSPAQIEKLLRAAGYTTQFMEQLISKESSGVTLVRSDDRREGISVSPASVFTKVGFDG
jgi:hypothetical protein